MKGYVKMVGNWLVGLHIPLARFRRRVALALSSTSARYLYQTPDTICTTNGSLVLRARSE